MDIKSVLKDRIVQVLLLVVILLVVCFVLIHQVNSFVHVDLYLYGLIFSEEWAVDFWYYSMMLWTFSIGAALLSLLSIIPHYVHSQKPTKSTKWLGFLLPAVGGLYLALSAWFLYRMDWIVQNTMLEYGLVYSAQWSSIYYSYSTPAFVLMMISFVILWGLSLRTFDIVDIEIVVDKEK